MTKNNHNLQVGDKIKIDNVFEIGEVGPDYIFFYEEGTTELESSPWSLSTVNEKLDIDFWTIVERAAKPFPEKWSAKSDGYRGQFSNFLLASKINSIYNGNTQGQWYNFNRSCIECMSDLPKYEVVTIEQLREHYLNEKTMEKKILGYNLKKEFKDKEEYIAKALDTSIGKIYGVEGGYWLPSSGSVYQNAVDMKVLDLWFEPIYKSTEIKLSIGNPSKEVIVKKEGVFYGDTLFDRTDLETIKDKFTTEAIPNTTLNFHIKKVWIGCESGTEITRGEIQKLIEEYVKLNK